MGTRWRFYRTSAGATLARNEISALPVAPRAAVIEALKRRERGEHFDREDEKINAKLRAIRVFHDGMTYRVLYAQDGRQGQILLALHCLTKKKEKLPRSARELAERRLADWRRQHDQDVSAGRQARRGRRPSKH